MADTIAKQIAQVTDNATRAALQKVLEKIADGTLLDDDSIKQSKLNRRYVLEEFETVPVVQVKDVGGAPTGTEGDENILMTEDNIFEYHIIGTQAIVAPVKAATGLNVGMDQADNDGVEVCGGIAANNRMTFVVGTDAFFFKLRFTIPNVSGADDCAMGFRKVEAYQGLIDNYDEMAALNVISGNITIETILNAGATGATDTTDNWGDAETYTLEVYVDLEGVTTFKIDGAPPTTTAAFTFDAAEVVTPFFFLTHANADQAGAVTLVSWECGLQ